MDKCFLFSDIWLPTFPYLELPLYREIASRGISISYVLQDGDIRLTDPVLSKVFGSLAGLMVVKKPKHLVSLMSKGDLLISRFAYKLPAGEAAAQVKAAKHKILHYDPSGIDIRVRECPATYLTAKSENLKKATLKKFPGKYKSVVVTGTIHNDAAAITQVNRDEFMVSYGLDPNKKFFVLTPANPGEAWMPGLKELYTKIVNTVRKIPGCELVVKAHPFDYLPHNKLQPGIVHKNDHYQGKSSWEVFAPGIKVIKAEEGYMAIKACDAVLNVRSSIAMETALFNKPLININRKDFVTNWPFDQKIMMDIRLNELEKVIAGNKYSVDIERCKEYVKRENFSGDGKAFVRTADLVECIMKGKV